MLWMLVWFIWPSNAWVGTNSTYHLTLKCKRERERTHQGVNRDFPNTTYRSDFQHIRTKNNTNATLLTVKKMIRKADDNKCLPFFCFSVFLGFRKLGVSRTGSENENHFCRGALRCLRFQKRTRRTAVARYGLFLERECTKEGICLLEHSYRILNIQYIYYVR